MSRNKKVKRLPSPIATQHLSQTEQGEIISVTTRPGCAHDALIILPPTIRRAPLVTDLRSFAADFWPEDETADDINDYLTQQRAADIACDISDSTS